MNTEILSSTLPWQVSAWDKVVRQYSSDHLPHAFLLGGEADTGKFYFAMRLAQLLLCKDPDGDSACGVCASCLLNIAGSNPDLIIVEPEEESRFIKVEQIRELRTFIETRSHGFGKRIIILNTAESLGLGSANALLKGLEEPPEDVVFLVLSDNPKSVLPTISSRCQVIGLPRPGRRQSLIWLSQEISEDVVDLELLLDLSLGRPFKALSLHDSGLAEQYREMAVALLEFVLGKTSSLAIASRYAKGPSLEILRLLSLWLGSLCKYMLTGSNDFLNSKELREVGQFLQSWPRGASLQTRTLFSLYNKVTTALGQLGSASNPNALLLLEDLFLQVEHVIRAERHVQAW